MNMAVQEKKWKNEILYNVKNKKWLYRYYICYLSRILQVILFAVIFFFKEKLKHRAKTGKKSRKQRKQDVTTGIQSQTEIMIVDEEQLSS